MSRYTTFTYRNGHWARINFLKGHETKAVILFQNSNMLFAFRPRVLIRVPLYTDFEVLKKSTRQEHNLSAIV